MTEGGQNDRHDRVSADGAFDVVVDGYDAVYSALAASPEFAGLWAQHAYGGAFPAGFEHISFLTFSELQDMADYLALATNSVLVDLACGAGGPGLWLAAQCGASLVGIDPSSAGLAEARNRAQRAGLTHQARYHHGTFARTGLADSVADGVVSIDAIQYAPDKTDAFREAHRVLRAGGRLAFSAFELDPARVTGLPVFGADPVADYSPCLERAGFAIDLYQESAAWSERVNATFSAVVDELPAITREMGEAGASSLEIEAALTLQIKPYRRRVIVHARRVDY